MEAGRLSGDGLDAADDLSGRELGMDQVAGLHGAAESDQGFTVGQKGKTVTAGEDGQGAQGLEASGEPGHAVAAGDEVVLECLTGASDPAPRVVAAVASKGAVSGLPWSSTPASKATDCSA